MPTPRRAGGTSLTTRSSKRTSPASGRSKPATRRSVVVLPHPEPPTSATSSPGAISRESPSTAVLVPKRLLTSRSVMRMKFFISPSGRLRRAPAPDVLPSEPADSFRVLLLPALHEPLLVLRVARLHEVEIDELHLGDLGTAHRHVRARDAGAAPFGVGGHRGLGHRPVEEAPGVLRILRAL